MIGKYFIRFTDKIVAQRVFELWDVNGDGGITRDEADLITSIPKYFLSGDKNENYKNITSLVGFESLKNCTEIGYGAFENTNLETAVFPPNLKRINQRAFIGTKIRKANLPDSCTYLASSGANDYMPFYNCPELEEFTMKDFVTLPDVPYVMNQGFSDCVKLKRFKCESFDYRESPNAGDFQLFRFANCVLLEECDFGELRGRSMPRPMPCSRIPLSPLLRSRLYNKDGQQTYRHCTLEGRRIRGALETWLALV